ncbi:hypothetical protein [Listeria phage LP-KV022]|uniref:Uncharacterized protein n=2 Tax=Homburgvirus LP110 TaxID=1921128 RepID=A0A5A4K0G2_9CAUD|nr:hypothetical protein LP110_017 [Listeria phage LP-110]AGI11520.1 hypothetical protein LP110_017 [Listeria phage LP-110]AWY07711.1 hypothetical protein [Listeria phage LP-KV022]
MLEMSVKIISEGLESYNPWSGAVANYEIIQEKGLLDVFESLLEEWYPEGLTETQVNDILWFDEDLFSYLGIEEEEEEENE